MYANYVIIIYRTVIVYFLLLVVFKMMGKKEVGQLTVIDLVVSILIAEIAAIGIDSLRPMGEVFLSIILLGSLQLLMALLTLRSKRVRDLVDGRPSIIIHNGEINVEEMRRQRYNFDDLMVQLRNLNISSVFEVDYAILEANGHLTAFKKDECPYLPLPIIVSGSLEKQNLRRIKKSEDWVYDEMEREGILFISHIYYAAFDGQQLLFITKETLDMKRQTLNEIKYGPAMKPGESSQG